MNKILYISNRLLYYILKEFSILIGPINRNLSHKMAQCAYEFLGILFNGRIGYIHPKAFIDNRGKIILGNNIVVSAYAVILAHDFSSLVKKKLRNNMPPPVFDNEVYIGNDTFIGAGAIILPGSHIGNYCIIGAGAVVKGSIPDYSIVIGNPCKIIKKTNE